MGWSEQVDSDPALKRKVAFWTIGIIVGLFVVVFGLILALQTDVNEPAKPKEVSRQEQPKPKPTSSSNDNDFGMVWVGLLVAVIIGGLVIWAVIGSRRQQPPDDHPVYGLDEYGNLVRLYQRKEPSWLYVLLFFWMMDDD